MLAADDAGQDILCHMCLDFDRPARAFDDHPLLVRDAVERGAVRMNIRGRFRRHLAQARQRALLAVHVGGEFRVGEHRGLFGRDLGPAHRAKRRLDVFRQGRVAVGREDKE